MAFPQLYMQFKSLSLFAKLGIGVALLVAFLIVAGGTKSCVSHFKDRQADKAIAEERARGEEHRQRADEWEAKAREYAAQAKLAEVAVQVAGAKVEAVAEKIKVEDAKLVEEMQRIGEPVDDPCIRVRRVCERLRIRPADCACTAN
jgi:hypothetical protein